MQIDIVGMIVIILSMLWQVILNGLPIAFAAVIAMIVYYRQKEYDLIRDRYLSDGIDGAADSLERTLSANRNNWARLLHLLKLYKSMGPSFDSESFKSGFITFNFGELKPIANQRIYTLINDKVIWSCYQKAFAAFKDMDDFITIEAPLAMKHNLLSQVNVKRQLVLGIEKRLGDINGKLGKISILVAYIGELARLFEQQEYTFKSIEDFRELDDVQELVDQIQNLYDEF